MVSENIKVLADILIESHAERAENIARHRAARCARMLEPHWAATWRDVADYIAHTESAKMASESF